MISKRKACQIVANEIEDVAPNLAKSIIGQITECPYDPYSDWTDTRESLPPKDVSVLCSGKSVCYIARWTGSEWHKIGNTNGGNHSCNPKAWMYLPGVYQGRR